MKHGMTIKRQSIFIRRRTSCYVNFSIVLCLIFDRVNFLVLFQSYVERTECFSNYIRLQYVTAAVGSICGDGMEGAVQCGPNAHCADDFQPSHSTSDTGFDSRLTRRTCACNPGYSGDGETCVDVDECDVKAATLLANDGAAGGRRHRHAAACDPERSICVNLLGSYRCDCLPGFIGDGTSCDGTRTSTSFRWW